MWFPDSKRIAYIQKFEHAKKFYDLVVQRLAGGQITTIHRWYYSLGFTRILVTPDGSRVITITHDDLGDESKWLKAIESDECAFRTWDVSDL